MLWFMALPMLAASVVFGLSVLIFHRQRRAKQKIQLQRAEDELHPLLKDYTTFQSYTTKHATYPRIRTFYRPHSHRDKHSDIGELPLLVFIHGLGGVLPQFAPLMHSLANIAPCFGLELAGHGRSSFAPKEYAAYTIKASVALWKTAIEECCNKHGHRAVVLIGHSMGCSISVLLTSSKSTVPILSVPVSGMIAICPRGRTLSLRELQSVHRLSYIPNFIVNILRWFDRIGGENSASVKRVLGDSNESDLKRLQLQWNRQYRTAVFKRITQGAFTHGYLSENVWSGLDVPLFLIAGESDQLTPPRESDHIVRFITHQSLEWWQAETQSNGEDPLLASTNGLIPATIKYSPGGHEQRQNVIQAVTIPAPAAHGLLYAHTTYRLVSALVEFFLATHVSAKLDFSYQLRLLTTSGKWDVKNLQKWKAVLPVSGPICIHREYGGSSNGLFRALKTMREQDDEHNPTFFLKNWADRIHAVIDISQDAPIYNTKTLENGGVEYHKFPTVSKVPPTPVEVQDFCSLVEKLVAERDQKAAAHPMDNENIMKSIAVHCHYGYNRTGFFVCSYLISRCGYSVQQAIDEFAKAKPPGIRHEHFLDILWLRFATRPQQLEREVKADAGEEKKKRKPKRTRKDVLIDGFYADRDTDHASDADLM